MGRSDGSAAKRIAAICLLAAASMQGAGAQVPAPRIDARAWLLAEFTSGQVLGAEQPRMRVEPASLTKLMTAYLVFEALREEKLRIDARVAVPERALRIPGSRMFIEPRKPVTVDELLRGLLVQSGNDAALALAEAAAGSEPAFVERMNRTARRLGMEDTHYVNASGLPDPAHTTTAQDLQKLAVALLRDFPDRYGEYFGQKEFRYNNITQLNRNRLLWLDSAVDGMKTGHTDAAGYCVVVSAGRGTRRLIAVLLGTRSENARTQESLKLLNWGFQAFDSIALFEKNATVRAVAVWKGSRAEVAAGFPQGLVVSVPRGEGARLSAELVTYPPLVAPVTAGQRIGMVRLALGGQPFGEYPLVALGAVHEAGLLGRAWDTLRLWFR